MRLTWILLVLVCMAAPVALAHGEDVELNYEDHDIDERFTLADRGTFVELNMHAKAGQEIRYVMETDNEPVYFDLHVHKASVEYFVQNNSTTGESGTWVVPEDNDYSIYVGRAQDGSANVRLQVQGHFAVTDTIGFEIGDDETAPAPGFVAVLAAGVAVMAFLRRRAAT